jgi:hypothetical protein
MSFKDNYFYTTTNENQLYIFKVVEFHRGEYLVQEFFPKKEIRPVNLNNEEIIKEMNKKQFIQSYPEYIL